MMDMIFEMSTTNKMSFIIFALSRLDKRQTLDARMTSNIIFEGCIKDRKLSLNNSIIPLD